MLSVDIQYPLNSIGQFCTYDSSNQQVSVCTRHILIRSQFHPSHFDSRITRLINSSCPPPTMHNKLPISSSRNPNSILSNQSDLSSSTPPNIPMSISHFAFVSEPQVHLHRCKFLLSATRIVLDSLCLLLLSRSSMSSWAWGMRVDYWRVPLLVLRRLGQIQL